MAVFVPSGRASRVQDDRQLGRLHVFGHEWGQYVSATDFWLTGANYGQLGSAGGGPVLADYGWTTTSMTHAAGAGADFGSASDVGTTPNGLLTNAGSDLVSSPVIFGDFLHMEATRQHLGVFPSFLMLEAYLLFPTASNNETTTRFGFFEDGGSPIVANDAMASVYSDGTNFICGSGGDSDAGPLIQTTMFGLRIRIKTGATADAVDWFTRTDLTGGFSRQGSFDRQTDEFPCGFGFGQGTSNVINMNWVHIWYSEDGSFPT